MGFPRTLFLHHLVLISLVSLTIAQPDFLDHFCNYTSTSAYKTNRDTLLSSLASNTDQYGFYTSSAGKNPDTVYALVLCRGDVKLDACRECINNSVTKLTQLYPDDEGSDWMVRQLYVAILEQVDEGDHVRGSQNLCLERQ